jgi:hypothetical protein
MTRGSERGDVSVVEPQLTTNQQAGVFRPLYCNCTAQIIRQYSKKGGNPKVAGLRVSGLELAKARKISLSNLEFLQFFMDGRRFSALLTIKTTLNVYFNISFNRVFLISEFLNSP